MKEKETNNWISVTSDLLYQWIMLYLCISYHCEHVTLSLYTRAPPKNATILNGSLLFNPQYLRQIKQATKDSFEISLSQGFRNCPWLLDLIKIWLRYWEDKEKASISKSSCFLSAGVVSTTHYTLFLILCTNYRCTKVLDHFQPHMIV